jgi:hypothetical protein
MLKGIKTKYKNSPFEQEDFIDKGMSFEAGSNPPIFTDLAPPNKRAAVASFLTR